MRTISASTASPTTNCDTQLKWMQVVQLNDKVEQTIASKQDTSCTLIFPIQMGEGKFRLTITNEDGDKGEVFFELNDTISGVVQLGNIVLKKQEGEIEEVTITGVPKKFIQIDAEKTTVTVENNPILEVSSIYDAILKIPGIIPSPGGGFAMGGQLASIYFEGIPSSLSTTDLDNLLKSLPATSVQKIELISNPGASYDATTSGAIIDIISQGRVSKWLSGTITLNAGFNQNQKYSPSLMLSGKGKKYTWQIQTGYSYYERDNQSNATRTYNYFDTLTELTSKRKEATTDHYTYFRPSMTYRLNKNSFLQVNLGASMFKNDGIGSSFTEVSDTNSVDLLSDFSRKGNGLSLDGGLRYRVFLDTLKRKLEVSVNYNHYDYLNKRLTTQQTTDTRYTLINNSNLSDRFTARVDAEIPFPKWKSQLNLGAKLNWQNMLSSGAYRFNDSLELSFQSSNFTSSLPFDYTESNLAGYLEWKQRLGKKFSFTAGLRAEDFHLTGKVEGTELLSKHYLNLFPSIHTLYRITPDIHFVTSYSRKINMPNYSQFDPNVTGYFDNYTTNTGNSNLKPNFGHRATAKLTIFDYFQISVDYNLSNSINFSEVTADSNSYVMTQTFRTYNNVQSRSYFFAVPVPFGIFTQGLDFFNHPVDVDQVSFVYLYANNNKTFIPNYNYVNGNKSWWTLGAYSQVMLPWKLRLNIEYNFTAKGVYQISETTKPIHELELVLSREFLNDKWRVSLSMQDVLNTNETYGRTSYNPMMISNYTKNDTQSIWLKIAYSFGRYEKPSSNEPAIPIPSGAN